MYYGNFKKITNIVFFQSISWTLSTNICLYMLFLANKSYVKYTKVMLHVSINVSLTKQQLKQQHSQKKEELRVKNKFQIVEMWTSQFSFIMSRLEVG